MPAEGPPRNKTKVRMPEAGGSMFGCLEECWCQNLNLKNEVQNGVRRGRQKRTMVTMAIQVWSHVGTVEETGKPSVRGSGFRQVGSGPGY